MLACDQQLRFGVGEEVRHLGRRGEHVDRDDRATRIEDPEVRDRELGHVRDQQRYPVAGKVAWITPSNASGGRTQGVGVRFPADEKTRGLKLKIEELLGTSISSSKPTQTL